MVDNQAAIVRDTATAVFAEQGVEVDFMVGTMIEVPRAALTAGEIADQFDMKRPSISHHLSVLKSANLVQSTRAGQSLVYSLNTTVLDEFVQYVMDRFQIGGDDGDPDTSSDS